MQATFLFHDYETFGADARRDRPSQFAAIRTDEQFNVIGEPVVWYCQPADDYLPHPDACLITGLTPQKARREGMPETEFAGRIADLMQVSNTCSLGYNTLRFDDEISRHLFYRNFIDPYGREWQNGNSRWDLIDVVRAFYALRPDGIQWPEREPGVPSFKLEHLSQANGIEHGNAHDALADVYATIELAKLLRAQNARLFDYLLSLRRKQTVAEQLDVQRRKPMLHISRRYPAARGCSALIIPLARHPSNPNGVIVYDLSVDPEPLFELSPEAIRARVFASADELSEGEHRIPLKVIHINRSPVVMPISVVDETVAQRLGIDKAQAEQHWKALAGRGDVAGKVEAVFGEGPPGAAVEDPDLMLYSGAFFSGSDKREMARVRECPVEALHELQPSFQDPRLEEMLFRYRARNYPVTLSDEERRQWEQFRWERMNSPQLSSLTLQQFARAIERLNQQPLEDRDRQLLEELVLYVEGMMPEEAFG
ncbi:exodeoxyribonuclease I [Larsenimonas rhizosphaerae]|uniref:exodeoxyribonuclease I n=1 Tax=Larsenimonas rhizosphaerae TaxID=2944682 RepID=UPI0020338C7D|nr:exodeoxyribonuclease I [Larsenimonas rhizosphaerae]